MHKFTPVFVFLSLILASGAQARTVDRTLGLVNAEVVLQSDITAFHKTFALRHEIDPFIQLLDISSSATSKQVLDYLVQERLVLQKFPATEDEIEEEINAVQRNNHIDRDRLKEVLSSQGVKFDDYRKLMAVSVSKRKLIDRELRPLAAVSDEDVKNFYYTDASFLSHRKEQKLVLTYSLQQLLVPNSEVAEAAQKKLKAGTDFDSVASELASKGVESSKLANISEENMNSKIREAIQGLKVGETTKTLSAGTGYMILRIQEVGAPKDPVFEAEKEKIRGTLFQKGLLAQLKLWSEREHNSSYVHLSQN
ncbi:MAG: peptidylprolyl isomerase [Bdellovibrionota bacterium]